MNGKRSIILPLVTLLLLLLSCGVGYAQSTGAIVGTVKETTGAVIPGAVVKITNQGTGITREIASDDNGRYVAESLPVGVYDITTEVAGFKRFAHKEINLNVADRLNIDIVMEVGQVSEVVTVQGGPPVVQTETGAINYLISGNQVTNASGRGGAIYNNTTGTINLTNSTISENSAPTGPGGGLYFSSLGAGTGNITSCTITGNTAQGGGGIGVNNPGTVVTLKNTIVAGNTSPGSPDISGPVTSAGYNLIGDNSGATITATTGDQVGTSGSPINPLLGPLQNNGGPTLTRALLTNSPAIDAGNAFSLSTDQRGFTRPFDTAVGNVSDGADIGAFEVQASPATITATAGTPQTAVINTAFAVQLQATVRDAGNNPIGGETVTFTAPGSGASGTFPGAMLTATAVTNINGVATAPVFTANGVTASITCCSSLSNSGVGFTTIPERPRSLSGM